MENPVALNKNDDINYLQNPLSMMTGDVVDEDKRQKNLKQFYIPLQIPYCGFADIQIDKSSIAKRKGQINKPFNNQNILNTQDLLVHDGIYQAAQLQKFDKMNLTRLQLRLVRDIRQQFYKSTGQLVIQQEFFTEKVSRLINLSFQQNPSLAIYQKNAILSERSNQKKSEPFQIQIMIGQIKILKHQLQSQQQKKFQEIRPLLQQLQSINKHPKLYHLSKVIQVLTQKHTDQINNGASAQTLNKIKTQISNTKQQYQLQVNRLEKNMKRILDGWKQIKQIRRNTGFVNVPWRIIVKQYLNDGKQQYQIGLSGLNVTQKLGEDAINRVQAQRRSKIQQQKYYLNLIVNNIIVATSSKVNIQWPSYSIQFFQKFIMHVYTMPASIKIQVVKDGYIKKIIDCMPLKLPGQYANSITSSEKRYISQQFSSNGQKFRKKKQQPQGLHGMINYKIQWKGQNSKMPPSNITFADDSTVDTSLVQDNSQKQLLLDLNDPRKIKQKKHKQKKIGGIVIQKSKKQSVLPFGNLISTRQLLLKLRGKNQMLEGKTIPLTQQKIKKRSDLLQIIEQQKAANIVNLQQNRQKFYHPLEGIFKAQPEQVKQKIKQILLKIISNHKHITSSASVSSFKYKLVDQIINQYSFQQMVSPIVVFFKDLFTQKRKLGPKISHSPVIRQNISQLQINIHINSANNIPTRQNQLATIGKYRKTRQQIQKRLNAQQIGLFAGYGPFFQQPPNLIMQNYPYYNNNSGQMEMAGFNPRGQFGNNYQFGNGYGNPRMDRGYGNPGMLNQPQAFPRPNLAIDYNENPHQIISNIQRVRSYIEVRFRKEVKWSTNIEGIAPEWNESLNFYYNLKRENSTIQHNYYSNQKNISLILFDMVQQSKPSKAITELRIQKTKFYLGMLEVPLSTLIAIPKLSGTFKISKPLIMFGYITQSNSIFQQEQIQAKTDNPSVATYLSVDFSFNPQIQSTIAYNHDRKFNLGQQNSLLLQHANDWIQQLNVKRYIRLWLNNLQGNSIFISRYLNQIQPPPTRPAEVSEKWIERTARFVSLIPHKNICKILQNSQQFHLKCEQFLDLKMGDDHAILLCNYFNSIDKIQLRLDIQSYLIIGKGFPEGKTMYVLRRNKKTQQFEIWNPRTGDPYSYQKKVYQTVCCCFNVNSGIKTIQTSKDICPLLEVGCIVSKDNVYLNIQQNLAPGDISYELQNPKYWKPFLNQRSMIQFFNNKPIPPYQQSNIITKQFYQLKSDAQQIQHLVFDYLRQKIKTQRKNHPMKPYSFQLNTQISNFIRDQMLLQLQNLKFDYRVTGLQSKLYSQRQKSQWLNVIDELKQIKSRVQNKIETDKKFYGFPLNFSFTTVQDAWQKIANTQIHLVQKQDVQFVLTVRAFCHPCYITSVWIFLGLIQ